MTSLISFRAGAFPVVVAVAAVLVACMAQPQRAPGTDNQQVQNRGADKDRWWDALPRPAWTGKPRLEPAAGQGWFEVYEVGPGVLAIYEPGQFEEVVSYLILGAEQALLFDTGLGIGDIRALVEELTPLPVTVLNSHTHYDHIGGNHLFRAILGTDTGFTARNSGGLPPAEVREFVGAGWIWKATPPDFDAAAYAIAPFRVSGHVHDGTRIDLGGRILEVLLTPGHAPDSLCLLDRQHRLLFTGDTFYPAPLYTHLEGSDFYAYAETAERLAGYTGAVDWLMPGHNEPAVSSRYLTRMSDAFRSIVRGDAPFVLTDGHREYAFEGFSVIVDPQALAVQ